MNQPQTATEHVSLKRVLLPTEHGGWAFLAEPVFLGSLVAFSWAGLAIALAAVAGFLARQPLRLFVMDRRASAIALAGGWSMAHALGLWVILAARAVPTILYVRARLRLDRREPAGVAGAIAAHVLAVIATALLAGRGVVPWSAAGAITLLAARCAYGLSAARPAMTTKQIGISEAIFGAITVFATAWGAMAGA